MWPIIPARSTEIKEMYLEIKAKNRRSKEWIFGFGTWHGEITRFGNVKISFDHIFHFQTEGTQEFRVWCGWEPICCGKDHPITLTPSKSDLESSGTAPTIILGRRLARNRGKGNRNTNFQTHVLLKTLSPETFLLYSAKKRIRLSKRGVIGSHPSNRRRN